MDSEVYRVILSAQIQLHFSKLNGQSFTLQTDNDLQHTSKAAKDFFFKAEKWNVLNNGHHLIRHSFH